jgi:D-xylose transport system permease protein
VTTGAAAPAPDAPIIPSAEEADDSGLGGAFDRWVANFRSGEVGVLPILFAILLITGWFYYKNSNFLNATNVNNLVTQMAGTAITAFGVVFVLLIGEIDLSISYIGGVAGVTVAELQLPGSGHEYPGLIAIAAAIAVGALLGAFQGSFVAFLLVPSFVVTLAGNLAFQGIILRSIPQGVIVIQNVTINNVANYFLPHTWGWITAAILSAGYGLLVVFRYVNKQREGVPTGNVGVEIAKVILVTAATCGFVYWSNTDPNRGVPFAGVLMVALLIFWSFIADVTTFGRHVYAVGGNAEAARRAGINVPRIRLIVFMISGMMAALGGIVFASRLRSVDLSAGGGTILLDAISAAVIGGVSLFGGRGHPKAAVLGALVIAMIANGIQLVGYSVSTQYIVTGSILLAAVTLDTVTRRRLAAAGR